MPSASFLAFVAGQEELKRGRLLLVEEAKHVKRVGRVEAKVKSLEETIVAKRKTRELGKVADAQIELRNVLIQLQTARRNQKVCRV